MALLNFQLCLLPLVFKLHFSDKTFALWKKLLNAVALDMAFLAMQKAPGYSLKIFT